MTPDQISDLNRSLAQGGDDDLLPCPFCGAPNPVVDLSMAIYPRFSARGFCYRCRCRGPMAEAASQPFARQEAIRAWNTRAPMAQEPVMRAPEIDSPGGGSADREAPATDRS